MCFPRRHGSNTARLSLALAVVATATLGCPPPTPPTPTGVVAGRILVVSALSAKAPERMRAARAHIAVPMNASSVTTTGATPVSVALPTPTLPVPPGVQNPLPANKLQMEWRAGEALVLFKGELRDAGFSRARAYAALEATRARAHLDDVRLELGSCAGRRLCQVRLKSRAGPALTLEETTRTAQALTAMKPAGVVAISRNFIRRGMRFPNDQHFGFQWNYAATRMPTAWDLTTGDPDLVVAIVDSGIKKAHPDLIGRLVQGVDLIEEEGTAVDGNGRDTDPEDPGDGAGPDGLDSFHGTHVAGTIGAATDNTLGVSGILWEGKIQPIRVLGQGLGGADSDILAGILWAVGETDIDGVPNNSTPARVVNLSLGGSSDEDAQAIWEDVINELTLDVEGVYGHPIIVTSAGNEDQPAAKVTPANVAALITVGASRFDGARAGYSNFGPAIDLMAPGGDLSLDQNADGFGDGVLSLVGVDYAFDQGTSMSAPHVAGIAGLLLSVKPELDQAGVQRILKATANPAGQCGAGCGSGAVDAAAALIEAGAVIVPTPRLSVDASTVFIGKGLTATTIGLTNLGSARLDFVARLSGPQSGLFTLSAAAGSVEPASRGGVTVTVARDEAQAGSAFVEIIGQGDSVGQDAIINVRFDDGPPRGRQIDIVAVAAFQVQENGALKQVGEPSYAQRADGYLYEIAALPAGPYFIFAVGDDNADGVFDTAFESFGAFPIADTPSPIDVVAGQRSEGIDFALNSGFVVDAVGAVGAPCTADADCTFMTGAECIVDFNGGYCSRTCDDGACGPNAVCATLDCGGGDCNLCLAACVAESQCRVDDGFTCDSFNTCTPGAFAG